jgi:membrane-associated phospholipid phosphatase
MELRFGNAGILALKFRNAVFHSRSSPVSRPACFFTFALVAIGLIASAITKLRFVSLPNILPLVIAIAVLDIASGFAPPTRLVRATQTIIHGLLYLVVTCSFAVLAAYSMQRFAMPVRDELFASLDRSVGLIWLDYARWVDAHLSVHKIFYAAYYTIEPQILLPLLVFACSNKLAEVREYLLAFSIALTFTIIVSALLPAVGPIALVDRQSFSVLYFTGATPLDHLTLLRRAGPLVFTDAPGGIATFPSFHATIAILTPLALRKCDRLLVAVIVLDVAMLGATVTEGAHYFVDLLAGGCMAVLAYGLANRIMAWEDRARRPVPGIGAT